MTRAAREPESIATLPTLRLLTCGSVDDGKSTLIGRLLVEQNAVFADQLAAAASDSRKYGTRGAETDLALLVDGLEDERQQGITIDVAYRYFSTPRRSFIIADTPGHEQFTRNMATGASNADLAVLLVDARKGILAQTRRHATIAALLGVRHLVLAVNKMDLVAFSEATFTAITAAFAAYATSLDIASVVFIPICAVDGDTIARRGDRLPWYGGPTLLEHLETVEIEPASATQPFRFPVQWINRGSGEFRGLSGTIAGGAIRLGEAVLVAASGRSSTVARIIAPDGDAIEAKAGDAVTLVLADDVDVSRGDVLCAPKDRPEVAENFAAHLIWMDQAPARTGRSYLMKAATRLVPAAITRIGRIDIETLQDAPAPSLALNDIGVCDLTAGAPFTFDPYAENRKMGAFILIDRETNATAAAGMILRSLRRATNVRPQELALTEADRSLLKRQRPAVLWFTGLSGAGKSTIANLVEARLHALGCHTMLLDGDNLRHGLNKDLGFSEADRSENIRRAGEVAKLMTEAGIVVLCSFISPFAAERDMVRMRFDDNFLEVFVDTSLEECMARDPKGLYRRALAGEIPNFTGIGQAYEPPRAAEIIVGRDRESAEDAAMRVVSLLAARGFIEAA